VLDVSGRPGDSGRKVLMTTPTVCPECGGSGSRLYSVETVDGEEEWAWELCPECEGGDAFPSREGEEV
jgi:DnaJ-class molecular chaperone